MYTSITHINQCNTYTADLLCKEKNAPLFKNKADRQELFVSFSFLGMLFSGATLYR